MTKAVKAVPDGMHTLSPHICCAGAGKAMDFYKQAFGAIELMRMPGPDGRLMHGAMRIGDSTLMVVDEMPEWGALGPLALKGSPVTIHMAVEDVDAVAKRAIDAGCTVKMPVADMFWGDRYGIVVDPFGHSWSIASHIRDMTPDEMMAAGKEAMASMASPDCMGKS